VYLENDLPLDTAKFPQKKFNKKEEREQEERGGGGCLDDEKKAPLKKSSSEEIYTRYSSQKCTNQIRIGKTQNYQNQTIKNPSKQQENS
jgi:hypothetical protein